VSPRYAAARILDVGFVGSYHEPFVHLALRRQLPNAHIFGVDLNLGRVLRWGLSNTLAADGARLPFPTASFDTVLCLELLEHLYCPLGILGEFWRVLRPGGELVITTPNAWGWWSVLRSWLGGSFASRRTREVYRRYLGDEDHKQFHNPLSLMNILDDAGFQTIDLSTKNHAIPLLQRWFTSCDLLDWRFFPMNRLGQYLCLIAQKTHAPKNLGSCAMPMARLLQAAQQSDARA
jgi:SAM-dependent methyltransferase